MRSLVEVVYLPLLDWNMIVFAVVAPILSAILFKRRFLGAGIRHTSGNQRDLQKIANLDAGEAFIYIMNFHTTCEKQKAKGLFVHAGFTGKKSREKREKAH